MIDLPHIAPGRLVGEQPTDEADHLYVCADCGQAVDMRELADVLFHEFTPDHEARKSS